MVANKLQELLDISRGALIKLSVVNVDHDLLKIVLLFVPLQLVGGPVTVILTKVLVEEPNGQMFKVIVLNTAIELVGHVMRCCWYYCDTYIKWSLLLKGEVPFPLAQ